MGVSMIIVGIDPGLSGGIAWYDSLCTGHKVGACKMPGTLRDIYGLLSGHTATVGIGHAEAFYMVEKVGTYMPGNSGPAAAKFARHCGALDMALIAIGLPWDNITPVKWQKEFIGAPAWGPLPPVKTPERKRELARRKQIRKNLIKEKAQRLYPHVKVTLATADALGILTYAMNLKGAS